MEFFFYLFTVNSFKFTYIFYYSNYIINLFSKDENDKTSQGRSIKVQGQKVIDTGGGFLIEDDDALEQEMVTFFYKIL